MEQADTKTRRFYKRPIFYIPVIIVAVPAVWVAWWLGSPLFLDKTVIEEFPSVAPVTVDPVSGTATTSESPAEGADPSDSPATPDPATPVTTGAGGGGTVSSVTTAGAGPDASPAGPVALLAGMFMDADSSHRGSGDATIYELEDGSKILRLENLDVTNGPDLHVFLTPVADPQDRQDVKAEGYLDLGELKGNKGDQNYEIEGEIDLSRDWTVVIYCVPFHVMFSTAPLA